MDTLKLVAMDAEDLEVISAHLQDAVLRVADMAWMPREKRFAAIANRFDWSRALAGRGGGAKRYERRRTAIRFERVLAVKVQNVSLGATGDVLDLLAIHFEETDAPAGRIILIFAGGGAIRLDVECIEAEMRDLGAVWRTRRMPDHGGLSDPGNAPDPPSGDDGA